MAAGWPLEFNNTITYNNNNRFNELITKDDSPLLLLSTDHFSGFPMMDCWDYALPVDQQESFLDSFPEMEVLPMTTDHLYNPPPLPSPPTTMYYHHHHHHSSSPSMDAAFPNPHLLSPECKPVQDSTNSTFNTEYEAGNNELGAVVWNNQYNKQAHQQMMKQHEAMNYNDDGGTLKVETGEKTRHRNNKRTKDEQLRMPKLLTRKIISLYFYMPITQAAKELNIGLTLLKKRCRELGIRRWPHRKLMSLQTLINNVQELGKEGSKEKLKMAVEVLERERKLMEELPDMQLEDKTKKLRQACFKANYKKRKMMAVNGSGGNTERSSAQWNYSFRGDSCCSCTASVNSSYSGINYVDEEEDDEMRSLLSDCFSSSDNSLMV